MWFIIRAGFCIGIVFSMATGPEAGAGAAAALSSTLAAPAAMGNLLDGALSACKSDPKPCLEIVQRLAGFEAGDLVQPGTVNAGLANAGRLVSDTLTPADRSAAPWHGGAREPRALSRQRSAARPTI